MINALKLIRLTYSITLFCNKIIGLLFETHRIPSLLYVS